MTIPIKIKMTHRGMYRGKNQIAIFQEELLIPSDQYDPRALPEFMGHKCFEIQWDINVLRSNKKLVNYSLGNLNYIREYLQGKIQHMCTSMIRSDEFTSLIVNLHT